MNYTQNRKIMQGLLPRQPYGVSPPSANGATRSVAEASYKAKPRTQCPQSDAGSEGVIRGWIGYFRVADMKRTLMSWNEWMRRRF